MAGRSILFSAPMVRAILREIEQPGTGKTQTRRVLKPLPRRTIFFDPQSAEGDQFQDPRYAIGDRLYVREAWRVTKSLDHVLPRDLDRTTMPEWLATDPELYEGRKRPGMHLPRWASRITLIVTDVRPQRLQQISEADAWAEGVEDCGEVDGGRAILGHGLDLFQSLWDSLNADRGHGWDANPWVAAYTFRPILGNIDSIDAS